MQAEKDRVVTFHYRLGDEHGETLDSSHERGEPLVVLLGQGMLIPGMEQALIGRAPGEKFEIVVPPEQGYGLRKDGATQRLSKKFFLDADRLKVGDRTMLEMHGGGQRAVTVVKIGSSVIDVDLNHPLAGKTLHFAIDLVDVRDATPEELAHGHAHGPGGHQH